MVGLWSCFFLSMMDKRDGHMFPHLFIAVSLVKGESIVTHDTITYSRVVVAYHSLQSSTLYRAGGIFKKWCGHYSYLKFQALRFTTPEHPHCSFRHCLAFCCAAFSHSPPEQTPQICRISVFTECRYGRREVGCYLHMYRCQLDHVYIIANLR